ncbi:Signal recognition particle 9 kDa protein [Glycine soja]|uniref:Signal recognition particle 9 kDa protein n=1 Tax=Glycine soja TaxID=3848 RepID=A0A445LNR1_GLYSO|nr:Signal recognition particle 9 kDa protein [Glycine soja]
MILNLNPEELSRNRVSVSVNYNAMVYITSWDEFVERSVQLFRADPDSTRYVMKYRHCDGKLVLKVTDNRQLRHGRFQGPAILGNCPGSGPMTFKIYFCNWSWRSTGSSVGVGVGWGGLKVSTVILSYNLIS